MSMTPNANSSAPASITPEFRRRGPRALSGKGGFRNRTALHGHSLHFGPNMTPMVDVVMVILIFFMASAAFLGSEWFLRAAIPIPGSKPKDDSKQNDLSLPPIKLEVVLEIAEGSAATLVSFGKFSRVPMETFEREIKQMGSSQGSSSIEITLRPASNVPYRDVVKAHAACDAAGIHKVGYRVLTPAAN